MYRCTDCGKKFEEVKTVYERHGLDTPPYEKIAVCPSCNGTSIEVVRAEHCRCCGIRLSANKTDYCSDACRIKGRKLWQAQSARRRRYTESSLIKVVTMLERYNKEHKTNLSYGNFVAKILPKMKGGNLSGL